VSTEEMYLLLLLWPREAPLAPSQRYIVATCTQTMLSECLQDNSFLHSPFQCQGRPGILPVCTFAKHNI
jgi:hypothetical protein